jgi:cellulose synthase/poly-beta-1,6-N-acetylglucosamine synthase-like glycosyltransferase
MDTSDVKAEAEVEAETVAPEAVAFWWKQKRKHLKICRFRFRSVNFSRFLLTRSYFFQILFMFI